MGGEWLAGQQAFEKDDYTSALLFFQTARDSGLEGPAVHYNIAVCHFKLEEFDRAGQAFRLMAGRFPRMLGLAEYNLGLVSRRLGDSSAAKQHFLRAYELSPADEKLRILASTMLNELEPKTSAAALWTGAFGLRAGIDDNVELRDAVELPAGVAADSPMADVFASIQGPLNREGSIRLDVSAYLIRFLDADEFDQSEIRGGVLYHWSPNNWRIQVGGHLSAGTIGGSAFDRKSGASARATRYLSRNTSVDLRYEYDDIREADPLIDGIAGSRQQLNARYRWYADSRHLMLRCQFESNDRRDPSVSPKRNRVGIDYRYQPEAGWDYEGGVDFRASDFKDLTIRRKEDSLTVNAALTRTFHANWQAILDYRYSVNDSSDPAFSYYRSQVTLGAMKAF